ncbi:hypothetical protein X739_31200 [Mesorhizobium sp. LNHC220B00]|nr:hypothetical protein X739_31200 [Mesorhizobium sp. LNHC220B00]ESY88115.1 hypothetical protein X741_31945 [Mesorhizobium sp. LNHC229A00]ESY90195.1 hypothetical protein X738_30690 [Mesorhizobium sp. LNHC209A00]
MTAPTHRDKKVVLSSESHRVDYISDTEAACYQSWVSVDCRVPNTARRVVFGISGPD